MSVISFEENIYKLLTLKREAEKFYQTYSKVKELHLNNLKNSHYRISSISIT